MAFCPCDQGGTSFKAIILAMGGKLRPEADFRVGISQLMQAYAAKKILAGLGYI